MFSLLGLGGHPVSIIIIVLGATVTNASKPAVGLPDVLFGIPN